MYHLQHQTLEDTRLLLDAKDHNYLGPDLVLRRCNIILPATARAFTLTNVQIIDCQIQAKKKFSKFHMWCNAKIKGCTFSGLFEGNDFGHWLDVNPGGSIEDCDFSDTILDSCRMMDCAVESIKLPKWPCFTVRRPLERHHELESMEWPGKLGLWFNALSLSPEATEAVIGYGPGLVKRLGGSEQELKECLGKLDGIMM